MPSSSSADPMDNAATIKQNAANDLNFNIRADEDAYNHSPTEDGSEAQDKQQSFVIQVPARQRKPIEVKISIDGTGKGNKIRMKNSQINHVSNSGLEAVALSNGNNSTLSRAEK